VALTGAAKLSPPSLEVNTWTFSPVVNPSVERCTSAAVRSTATTGSPASPSASSGRVPMSVNDRPPLAEWP
jgi:hypothetical protein